MLPGRHFLLALVSVTVLASMVIWMQYASVDKPISENTGATINQLDAPQSERQRFMQGQLRYTDADRFAEYHRAIRTRSGETAPSYPANYRVDALEKARLEKGAGRGVQLNKKLSWQHRGPGNVAGRARAVVPHPEDPLNTWFVGSASGGVWKTEDRGASWVELTADLPNLSTSTMDIPVSNPDVIYIGTGEGFGSYASVYGEGLWKSGDGGETWMQLASTADDVAFTNILRLVVDPEDEQRLVVATSTGFRNNQEERSYLMRTIDGGRTWETVYESPDRVQQVVAQQDDFNVLYATVRGKGVVKSTDGGQTWREVFDFFNDVRRLELAIAPTDPSRLYISAEGGPFPSTLYMSNDAGNTWAVVSDASNDDQDWLLSQGWYNNTIAVHPYDPDIVFVGGVDIMRYDIAQVTYEVGTIKEVIEFDPQQIFAVDRVISGPETATRLSRESGLLLSEFMPVEVRWGPEKSQKAHRFIGKWVARYEDYVDVPFEVWNTETGEQLMVLFEDQDLDLEWDITGVLKGSSERMLIMAEAYDPVNPHLPTTLNAFDRAQYVLNVATEDTELEHGPFPSARVQIIPQILTYNEGVATRVTSGYGLNTSDARGVHVDHHHLVLVPTGADDESFFVLDANDGGLAFSTDNGQTFTQTGDTFAQSRDGFGTTHKPVSGMNTSQFYGVDKMNGGDRYVGGTQDNGSWVSPDNAGPESVWAFAPSGDGFEAVWHYTNPDWIIQSSQFNRFYRSKNGGGSWEDISPGGGGNAPFLSRLAKTNQDPDLLFAVTESGILRTTDFGSSWDFIKIENPWPISSRPTVRISLAASNVVWAGAVMSDDHSLQVSTDAGRTFQVVSAFRDATLGPITNIATHPYDSLTAYALFSFADAPKVLRTTDAGETWMDLSGFDRGNESQNGFPDVAAYSLLVMPHNQDVIWVGTEIGIFESTNGGDTWQYADNGLPAVAVWEMKVVNDQIVVATHGRGVWTITMPELAGYEPFRQTLPPAIIRASGGNGALDLSLDLRDNYDSTHIILNGERAAYLGPNPAKEQKTIRVQVPVSGSQQMTVRLIAYDGGSSVSSNSRTVSLFEAGERVFTYSRTFEEQVPAFFLKGFAIVNHIGFDNKALHSPHPYENFEELVAQSLIPVVLQPDRPILSFNEIVLVEPGKPGAEYGTPDFFDFVVVEGSNDNGNTWVPLADAYDARRVSLWEESYEQNHAPTSAQYVKHSINLMDTFSPGESVLFRFRMVTDNSITGWGWVIDDILLEEAVATSSEPDAQDISFGLNPNYPNPFSTNTTIEYTLASASEISLSVYDVSGRLIRELVGSVEQQPGRHRIEWDGQDASGIPVASGVYFYRLRASGNFQASRQLVVIR